MYVFVYNYIQLNFQHVEPVHVLLYLYYVFDALRVLANGTVFAVIVSTYLLLVHRNEIDFLCSSSVFNEIIQ